MKILSSLSNQIRPNGFSVSKQEWINCLKDAFPPEPNKKHGFLYINGHKIEVSAFSNSSNLTIDEIVQISRQFLEHQSFSTEDLGYLKNCYTYTYKQEQKDPNGFCLDYLKNAFISGEKNNLLVLIHC